MWPFRPKPKPPAIPPFEPTPEPQPEPMEVVEVINPSDSLVIKFKDLIQKRLKGE